MALVAPGAAHYAGGVIRRWFRRSVLILSAVLSVLLMALTVRSYFASDSVAIAFDGGFHPLNYESLLVRDSAGKDAGTYERAILTSRGRTAHMWTRRGTVRLRWSEGPTMLAGFGRKNERITGERIHWLVFPAQGGAAISLAPPGPGSDSFGGSLGGFAAGVEWFRPVVLSQRTRLGAPGFGVVLPLPLLALLASLPLLFWIRRRIRLARVRGFPVEGAHAAAVPGATPPAGGAAHGR